MTPTRKPVLSEKNAARLADTSVLPVPVSVPVTKKVLIFDYLMTEVKTITPITIDPQTIEKVILLSFAIFFLKSVKKEVAHLYRYKHDNHVGCKIYKHLDYIANRLHAANSQLQR
jgi:hypothetical protein